MSVWWTKCNGRRTLFLQNFRNTAIYYSLHLQYIMYTQKIKLKEKAPNRPAFPESWGPSLYLLLISSLGGCQPLDEIAEIVGASAGENAREHYADDRRAELHSEGREHVKIQGAAQEHRNDDGPGLLDGGLDLPIHEALDNRAGILHQRFGYHGQHDGQADNNRNVRHSLHLVL